MAVVLDSAYEGLLVVCELKGCETVITLSLPGHNVDGRLGFPCTSNVNMVPLLWSCGSVRRADTPSVWDSHPQTRNIHTVCMFMSEDKCSWGVGNTLCIIRKLVGIALVNMKRDLVFTVCQTHHYTGFHRQSGTGSTNLEQHEQHR